MRVADVFAMFLYKPRRYPTVGVALFWRTVSDRLSSLSEELAVRKKVLLVYSF